MTISIIIFLCTIVMFFSGKVSLGLIGLLASLALQLTGVLPANTVWGNFTNSSCVMFAALFVLSAGLMKTSLVDKFVDRLSSVQGSGRTVLWGCLVISILMSVFMNSTAAVATMIPVVLMICERSNVNARKILKPCCDTANMWTASLPVGMGASSYLVTNQMIADMGGSVEMGIMDTAIMKIPVLIIVTVFYFTLAPKFLPNNPLSSAGQKQSGSAKAVTSNKAVFTGRKEILTFIIFGMTVALMLFGGLLNWSVPTYIFPVCGAVAMVLTGILSPNEAASKVPVSSLLLVGGMLNVAAALGGTGGADLIGNVMISMLGGTHNLYVIMAVLFLIPAICTQFMNNIAVGNAFQPLAIAACMAAGLDPRLGAVASGFAATASILTPMASAPQAMIMTPGEYKFLDYVKCAIIPFLIYLAALVIWSPLCAKFLWAI